MAFFEPFKIVFLLGAGASIHANLPDIKKITEDYYKETDGATHREAVT